MRTSEYDVAIVGAGPVGLSAAALLGRRGHRVAVVERFKDVFPLPRAVSLDADIMRIFQAIGVVEEILPDMASTHSYRWLGAEGEEIVHMKFDEHSPMGWAEHYTFWQPTVERALNSEALAQPTVDVFRGLAVEQVREGDESVELRARAGTEETPGEWKPTGETTTIASSFVVGADGANSTVRGEAGIEWIDLGFEESWLVVDVLPADPSRWSNHAPEQHCDPARPVTLVPAGVHHRRWEFMLLPGEEPGDFDDRDRVWELLAPYVSSDEAEIVRSAVYTFRSLVAQRMRSGRILLAGDAAHLMPPFMGQGMCSGIRDASNLGWRLDLILRGLAPQSLLDGYETERKEHSRALIDLSVRMGRVSCTLDPVEAAERDRAFRSGEVDPPPDPPTLEAGTLRGPDDPVAGHPIPQGRLAAADGAVGRADDLLGGEFLLLCRGVDPLKTLSSRQLGFLDEIRCEILSLDPDATGRYSDADGELTRFLADSGLVALIRRPDGYGYGSVSDPLGLRELIDDLRRDLGAVDNADPVARPT